MRIQCTLYLCTNLYLYFLLPSQNYNPPIKIIPTLGSHAYPILCHLHVEQRNIGEHATYLIVRTDCSHAWLRIGQFVRDKFICNVNADTNLILRMCTENAKAGPQPVKKKEEGWAWG